MKSKIFPQTGLCLVCAAPALAAGTSSLPDSAACAVILFLAGCAAVGAVHLSGKAGIPHLAAFSAIMVGTAVSLGGELIASETFPNSFGNAPTFALTGAPLFFAACFSVSDSGSPPLQSICCAAAAALSVVLLGILRAVLSPLPLSQHIAAGLIAAGCLAAVIKLLISRKEDMAWED